MRLEMPGELAARYSSPSQRTRVVSEAWGEENLYCSNCTADRLRPLPTNTPAIDYECPRCTSLFQLKSQRHRFASRINDAAYEKMREAILQRRTPNILALHYDPARWTVQNLTLVPSFAFSLSCLQKRNALRSSAERAGWVGCNILLVNIPPDARIPVVADGKPSAPAWVRRQYERLRPLEKLKVEARGWTLDVLNVLRSLGRQEFSLAEVYAQAVILRQLHPENRHVEEKIRQQLQQLRKSGFLEFLGRGHYRLR
jgi:type II restriction enzyme